VTDLWWDTRLPNDRPQDDAQVVDLRSPWCSVCLLDGRSRSAVLAYTRPPQRVYLDGELQGEMRGVPVFYCEEHVGRPWLAQLILQNMLAHLREVGELDADLTNEILDAFFDVED